MSNPNNNCLESMRCPSSDCDSYGPFQIECEALFIVTDEGTEDYEDVEWSGDSWCHCMECGHSATVKDFKETKPIR